MSEATNMLIGPVRISFPHLFEPQAPKGSEKKQYSCMAVFDPTTADGKRILKKIEAGIKAAEEEGEKKLEGVSLKKQRRPLKEGDEERPGDPYFDGKKILQCNNTRQPEVVDKDRDPITDESEIYAGIWAFVHVNFFAYNKGGGVGIGCSLNNVMKVKDGKRLDSKVSARTAFEGVTFDEDTIEDDDDETPAPKAKKKPAPVDDDEDDLPPKKKSKSSDYE